MLGSSEFVDKFFYGMKEGRPEFYAKRTTGARTLRQVRELKI